MYERYKGVNPIILYVSSDVLLLRQQICIRLSTRVFYSVEPNGLLQFIIINAHLYLGNVMTFVAFKSRSENIF